jgi:hypothetical protein
VQEDVIAAHSPFSPRALDLSRPHASLPASACRGSLPTPPCRGSLPAWNYRSSLPVSACHSSLPNTASRRSREAAARRWGGAGKQGGRATSATAPSIRIRGGWATSAAAASSRAWCERLTEISVGEREQQQLASEVDEGSRRGLLHVRVKGGWGGESLICREADESWVEDVFFCL